MTRRLVRPEDEERRKQQPNRPSAGQKPRPDGEDLTGVEDLKGGQAAIEDAANPKDD